MAKKNYRFETAEEYVKLLTTAEDAFENGSPIMSDPEYDSLRDEFTARFPKHKHLSKVGGKITSDLPKVKHAILMGSQNKVKTYAELESWAKNQIKKTKTDLNLSTILYLASEKLDGSSLSLTYKNGELVQAATRGQGDEGEDVTHNVKHMKLVPVKLTKKIDAVVRGEGILFTKDFLQHFPGAANSRNSAAGAVRGTKGDKDSFKHVSFLAYDIISKDLNMTSELEKFEHLKALGFTTPKYIHTDSFEELEKWYQKYELGRNEMDYEMDGLVVTFSDLAVQKYLGVVSNRPLYSRAYKFSAQKGITTLEGVTWQVGRTGTITPVGQVKAVKVNGVTITNVSLHNLDIVRKLGLKIGQEIEIERAGDVIPKVVKVVNEKGTAIKVPERCPSCGGKLTTEEIFLVCYNSPCAAQDYLTLLHWVATLDIKGFGDELVKQLVDAKLVASPVDFYKLKAEDIAQLERRGEKSAEKVLKNLHAKKSLTIPEFITALGIDQVGASVSSLAQKVYPTIEELRNADSESLATIKGIGEITAEALVKGLRQRKGLITQLLKVVEVKPYKEISGGVLSGQSFCFTGVRDKDLEKAIVSKGGAVISGVSKKLTYLVAKDPEDNSDKLVKARAAGVTILSLIEAQEKVLKA